MHAAFFDMDGTLLTGDSNNFLTCYLLQQGVIDESFIKPLHDFHVSYLQGHLAIEDFVLYIIKPLIGMPAQERDELILGCLHAGGLLNALRPGGIKEIEYQRSCGGVPMIVSSTMDCLINPIARALKVEYVAAAPLEYDAQGRITGKIAGKIPYQQQKVERIQDLLSHAHLSNADSCAYGDSINDYEMLCFAAHGFLIDPSPALLHKPEASRFTQLNWDN